MPAVRVQESASWRLGLSNGDIGIVTMLHERTHQIEHFREDFSDEPRA